MRSDIVFPLSGVHSASPSLFYYSNPSPLSSASVSLPPLHFATFVCCLQFSGDPFVIICRRICLERLRFDHLTSVLHLTFCNAVAQKLLPGFTKERCDWRPCSTCKSSNLLICYGPVKLIILVLVHRGTPCFPIPRLDFLSL